MLTSHVFNLVTQVEQEGTAAGSKDIKTVKWANPVLLRRAWSKAWLALLRLPLPQDILKKVGYRRSPMCMLLSCLARL